MNVVPLACTSSRRPLERLCIIDVVGGDKGVVQSSPSKADADSRKSGSSSGSTRILTIMYKDARGRTLTVNKTTADFLKLKKHMHTCLVISNKCTRCHAIAKSLKRSGTAGNLLRRLHEALGALRKSSAAVNPEDVKTYLNLCFSLVLDDSRSAEHGQCERFSLAKRLVQDFVLSGALCLNLSMVPVTSQNSKKSSSKRRNRFDRDAKNIKANLFVPMLSMVEEDYSEASVSSSSTRSVVLCA